MEEKEIKVYELRKIIKEEIEKKEKELKERKQNINKNYELARFDFIVIENISDIINTLQCIDEDLDDLQNRIRKRKGSD